MNINKIYQNPYITKKLNKIKSPEDKLDITQDIALNLLILEKNEAAIIDENLIKIQTDKAINAYWYNIRQTQGFTSLSGSLEQDKINCQPLTTANKQRGKISFKCSYCGKEKENYISEMDSKNSYCSRDCKSKSQIKKAS